MLKLIAALTLLAPASLFVAAPVRADDSGHRLQSLVAQRAPAICTVKAVLKTEIHAGGAGSDDEIRLQLQGVTATPEGMVIISNRSFSRSGMASMFGGGEGDGEGPSMRMTPQDFKVIFAGDDKEYGAFLAATDTKLGLAFLQIEDLAGKKLTPVDFSGAASAGIGDEVVSVSRLMKGYDYAPFFEMARVSGEITRPRRAWLLDGGISGMGLPVYTLGGDVLGVLTTVDPGVAEEGDETFGFMMAMRFLTGGAGAGPRTFVVPASSVQLVINQAKKKAVEVAADRAKNKNGAASPSTTTPPKTTPPTTTPPKKTPEASPGH